MAKYSIKDLENLSGVKAHTLRIWEKRYKFVVPQRTDTNIRYYSEEDLKKLLNVSVLNNYGYKISKVALFSDELLKKRVMEVFDESASSNSQVDNLVLAMIDLNEEKFEKLFSGFILRNGFENTMNNIIYPFLEKTGILWQIGKINLAQEHFTSNLIRQKIIVAIDSQIGNAKKNAKNFTLFLPEGELHEMGLLFFAYLLKKQGHNVRYFGQSIPIKCLKESEDVLKTDYFLTSLSSKVKKLNISDMISEFLVIFPDSEFIVSGLQIKDMDLSKFPRLLHFSNLDEFKEILSKI
ncbi:MAG: MerR family transcriptional regulator [Bacteroidota bacterium]|nr:MerR family transcriptional regulator [Bacteroidota bacterium]